jgi:ribosomal protein S11
MNIKFQRRNTFINLAAKRRLVATLSSGQLGYTGRKKSSPFVREQMGTTMAKYAIKTNRRLVDIGFVSKIGRFYRFVMKGVARTRLLVRMLQLKKFHPHGYVRARKKRRL